jgi:hypothetical protein
MSETTTCIFIASSVWKRTVNDSDRTHVEDEKDPGEVRPPGSDCFLVVLCVDKPRDYIPFSLLDDLPLDLRHSPAINSIVNEVFKLYIAAVTHAVSWLIASHTELLRSLNRFLFNPRSSAVQTSAQASPSST